MKDDERYGSLVANNEDVAWAIDYYIRNTPDDSVFRFESICEGFYHLAGGLLKIYNGAGDKQGLTDECKRLLTAHKRIIEDFLGAAEG